MENENNVVWYEVAEVELIYRSKLKASLRPEIGSSAEAFELLKQRWDMNKIEFIEEFKVLFLNRANKVLALYHVSSGGLTGTIADIRLIFVAALKLAACGMILCHNHPSGNMKPSRADEELTQKIQQAGKYFEINVLDHLIISPEGYLSFADEGLL